MKGLYSIAGIAFFCSLLVMACNCGHDKTDKKNNPADTSHSALNLQLHDIDEKIKKDSTKSENYFLKGNLLMQDNRFKEAYQAFSKAIHFDSTDVKYYTSQADAAIQGGNLLASITPLKKAISHHPTNDLKLTLAKTYIYLRQYDNANAVIKDVLHSDPQNDQAFVLRGFIQKETADTAAALHSFQEAVQNNTKNYEAYMQLGGLQAKRRKPVALQYYDNAIRIDSNEPNAYLAKATLYENLKKDADAKKTYRTLISRDPFNADAVFNLAFLYMQEDSVPKAYKYFDLCIKVAPDDADAYYYRGVCAGIQGKQDDAVSDWQQCLNLEPNHPLAKEALDKLKKKH